MTAVTIFLNAIRTSPLLARITGALPLLYLAWALPLLLVLAIVTPPWMNPDEPAHMLRISQIAHGGLLGYRFGDNAGGVADATIWQSINPMSEVIQHREQKVSLGLLDRAGAAGWGAPTQLAFANTAQYSPVLYAPAVLAVEIGRVLQLSVMDGLLAARIANALASALVAGFALSLARRTRLALAAVLVLPMTLALFASAAQDGLLIALTVAAVACIDHVLDNDRDASFRETVFLSIVLAVVIISRVSYLPLAALLLLCTERLNRRAWRSAATVAAVATIWTVYILAFVSVPLTPTLHPGVQFLYILERPWDFVTAVVVSIVRYHLSYVISFIGVLGWLDTVLPDAYYNFARLLLLLAFLSAAAGPTRRPWLTLLICVGASGALFLAMYATCTPFQADHVDGIQGRYFLPVAAVLALAVPFRQRVGEWVRPPALVVLLGFAAITPAVMIHALVLRYYLVP